LVVNGELIDESVSILLKSNLEAPALVVWGYCPIGILIYGEFVEATELESILESLPRAEVACVTYIG
jgi:hypothetical protein